ncbi:hypothetical protein EIP91_008114 [Steccherinum ochraceum]|uniref:Mid2 domain-containing protein n=1 Tax=Steccherinum ochraceum TaxID=92696 RepID=A0A4R0R5P1_9APHY|nr:hypothetical protein EIP91_008114 [Steccherinum ochraceum]
MSIWLDDQDSRVTYTGTWTHVFNAQDVSLSYAKANGSTFEFSFGPHDGDDPADRTLPSSVQIILCIVLEQSTPVFVIDNAPAVWRALNSTCPFQSSILDGTTSHSLKTTVTEQPAGHTFIFDHAAIVAASPQLSDPPPNPPSQPPSPPRAPNTPSNPPDTPSNLSPNTPSGSTPSAAPLGSSPSPSSPAASLGDAALSTLLSATPPSSASSASVPLSQPTSASGSSNSTSIAESVPSKTLSTAGDSTVVPIAPQTRSSSHIGAIAGACVGGVILVLGCVALLVWWRRRNRKPTGALEDLEPKVSEAADQSTSERAVHARVLALGQILPFDLTDQPESPRLDRKPGPSSSTAPPPNEDGGSELDSQVSLLRSGASDAHTVSTTDAIPGDVEPPAPAALSLEEKIAQASRPAPLHLARQPEEQAGSGTMQNPVDALIDPHPTQSSAWTLAPPAYSK